jgi:hypothetical protein
VKNLCKPIAFGSTSEGKRRFYGVFPEYLKVGDPGDAQKYLNDWY